MMNDTQHQIDLFRLIKCYIFIRTQLLYKINIKVHETKSFISKRNTANTILK